MKKFVSILLVFAILFMGNVIMVSAVDDARINYVFSGDDSTRSGYAQGTVTLSVRSGGEYALYWADDDGALDGYYEITKLEIDANESGCYTFEERVAIPADATRLIAVKDGVEPTLTNAAAVYDIPSYKRLAYDSSSRAYRYSALSDIHIDLQDGGTNTYYVNASKNFALALEVSAARDVDFIVTAGDQVTNASGSTLEWMEYQRVIAQSSYDGPIYEAIGNHEMRYAEYSECDVACGIEEFIVATGLDGTEMTMQARKPYYELTEPKTGDHFIFMALEYNENPSGYDEFSDEQLGWVEGLLEKYCGDGHRIFLIQHSAIRGYGAGDDHDDPAYGGAIIADKTFPSHLRFQELLEKYTDVIWLSGHTHVDFRDDVNFSDEDGTSCYMFHIPSVANTTRLSYDADHNRTLDRTFYDDTTQGYLVDVYADAVLLCGINYFDDKIYPAYTYIVGETAEGDPSEDGPTVTPTVYGDANVDGTLSIIDATVIQRHLAHLGRLTEEGLRLAKVDGWAELSIIDATLIQRKLAGLISKFPVEEGVASTAAQDAAATVKEELSAYYQYASYGEYAALKRAYRLCDSAAMTSALEAFRALRERVKITTVYFSDSVKMGNVHAYVWSGSDGSKIENWPGQKPAFVRTNSYGETMYAITVDTAKYDRIIFNNDDFSQTADIPLADQSGRVYYPISSDNSPYNVSYGVYQQMWRYDSTDTSTIYFTNTEGWANVYIYYWNDSIQGEWPGVRMTYVRNSSSGKAIYSAAVPKDAKVIFTDGTTQTVDIPAVADGRGYYPYHKNDDGKWQIIEYIYG